MRQLNKNRAFRHSVHKVSMQGDKIGGRKVNNPDLTPEQMLDAYKEWLLLG